MKAQTSLATLAMLAAMCPLALANTEPELRTNPATVTESTCSADQRTVDKSDTLDPSGSALGQHVGKTIFVKGQLISVHNGRVCIIPDETPDVQIGIAPVKRPKHGEVLSGEWKGNKSRQKRLSRLINGCESGDTIELAGTLCHVTSETLGDVQANIGDAQVPDSHLFFSVNDVTILSNGSPMQK
jgi:hypothetical protein